MIGRIRDILRQSLGLDRAIACVVSARLVQIFGSTGTVLLIVHFLSAAEQGYYYTLLSLVSMQSIFELGFSFVILQLAAHECAHLQLHASGIVEGNNVAHCRLASVLQMTIRWYLCAAGAMLAALLPLGALLFSVHRQTTASIHWHGPWIAAAIAAAFVFLLNPILSFVEGCGQVLQVASMRLVQAAVAVTASWSAMTTHHGLYAPALLNATNALVASVFLWHRRRFLGGLLRMSARPHAIHWRREVLPFQWQTAVSVLSVYFTGQVFTPILFLYRGPVAAGRMGMSMSIAGYLWALVIGWMSTKATPFGTLVARRAFAELDRVFARTLRQSLAVLVVMVLVTMTGIVALQSLLPSVAHRMVAPSIFALLLLTSISTFILQSFAIYLRSHKAEPFLGQSVLVAFLTVATALLFVPRWGTTGVALSFFLCTGIVGLASGTMLFRKKRKAWRVQYV
jgi:O-antigen/teichoic acid export membrane protein